MINWFLNLVTPLVKFISKFGLPKRKITGKHYYQWRDKINIGTVILTTTRFELSNFINPTGMKHGALYVGRIYNNEICYVIEATRKGVVLTDLVSFLTSKDKIVICEPKFIRSEQFNSDLQNNITKFVGLPYDYLFNKDGKAFYCFELLAMSFKTVYSELQLKCKEIVKSKRIYDDKTFLDTDFFNVVYDSRRD